MKVTDNYHLSRLKYTLQRLKIRLIHRKYTKEDIIVKHKGKWLTTMRSQKSDISDWGSGLLNTVREDAELDVEDANLDQFNGFDSEIWNVSETSHLRIASTKIDATSDTEMTMSTKAPSLVSNNVLRKEPTNNIVSEEKSSNKENNDHDVQNTVDSFAVAKHKETKKSRLRPEAAVLPRGRPKPYPTIEEDIRRILSRKKEPVPPSVVEFKGRPFRLVKGMRRVTTPLSKENDEVNVKSFGSMSLKAALISVQSDNKFNDRLNATTYNSLHRSLTIKHGSKDPLQNGKSPMKRAFTEPLESQQLENEEDNYVDLFSDYAGDSDSGGFKEYGEQACSKILV